MLVWGCKIIVNFYLFKNYDVIPVQYTNTSFLQKQIVFQSKLKLFFILKSSLLQYRFIA